MRRRPTPRLVYPPEPSHAGRGVMVNVMCQLGWAMVDVSHYLVLLESRP